MSKFKVGDKIRFLCDLPQCAYGVKMGDIGVINEINRTNFSYNVKTYNYLADFSQENITFELIDENKISIVAQEIMKEQAPILEKLAKEEGNKLDTGKPRISLIPKEAIWGMAKALTYGEKKYGTHNFRNGLSYSRLADAALRHLTVWLEGQDIDEESGNSHLDHALASLAMLKFMAEHRKDMDDRWLDPQYNYEDK